MYNNYNLAKESGMEVSLKIIKINKYGQYILEDIVTKAKYSFILEFYDLDKPQVNDILVLDKSMTDTNSKEFSQPYAFEPLKDDDMDIVAKDIAGLVTKDKKYILKRIYG